MHYFDTPLLLSRNDGLSIEQAFIKRAMDIFVSAVMLVITSPVFLVTAAAIKMHDGGPVFFIRNAVQRMGRYFPFANSAA